MLLSPVLFGTAFVLVLPVELPDKTVVATLILTARYRASPVLVGVAAAFAVQCAIAVAFGSVLTLLPERAVAAVAAALFGIGAAVLLREGFRHNGSDAALAAPDRNGVSWWRAATISFGVLFAAEWGDASQLAIAALTARYEAPVSIGLGAWLALLLVATIAVLLGDRIRGWLPTHWLQRIAGVAFTALALLAAYEAVTGG